MDLNSSTDSAQIRIDVAARGLVWLDHALFSTVGGLRRLWPVLDPPPHGVDERLHDGKFDRAVASPRGDLIAVVQDLGTDALLLNSSGAVVRSLSRDDYCADAYRYPLALFQLPGGQTGLAHCPKSYRRLELESVETGEPLHPDVRRDPQDFFHSRLQVSPDSGHLLSAGWIWHPVESLVVWNLPEALAAPAQLDGDGVFDIRNLMWAETSGACFLGDAVVASTSPAGTDREEENGLPIISPNMLASWSLSESRWTWRRRLGFCAGDLVPVDGKILALNQHPRLFDSSGSLVAEWPDLATGINEGSIAPEGWEFSGPQRVAVDPGRPRFAHTDGTTVTVVSWAS